MGAASALGTGRGCRGLRVFCKSRMKQRDGKMRSGKEVGREDKKDLQGQAGAFLLQD